MEAIARSLPAARGEERQYFDDLREHKLPLYRCRTCETLQAYPFARCTTCHAPGCTREWASGMGHVYSFTEVHRAGSPAFSDRVPYVIALVDLDEGVRALADLRLGTYAHATHIGGRVRVRFEELANGAVLPWFEGVAA